MSHGGRLQNVWSRQRGTRAWETLSEKEAPLVPSSADTCGQADGGGYTSRGTGSLYWGGRAKRREGKDQNEGRATGEQFRIQVRSKGGKKAISADSEPIRQPWGGPRQNSELGKRGRQFAVVDWGARENQQNEERRATAPRDLGTITLARSWEKDEQGMWTTSVGALLGGERGGTGTV